MTLESPVNSRAPASSEFLTRRQVAEILGVTPRAVDMMRGLPMIRLGYKCVRVLRSDLDAFITSRREVRA